MKDFKLKLLSIFILVVWLAAAKPAVTQDNGAVSFSVNGPTDPRYDGIQGLWVAMFMPPWAPPPTPVGAGPFPFIRLPVIPQARGIATFRPGDVWDYRNEGFVSEAEIFQSEPNTSTSGANPPNGTNNQILKTAAMGLFPTPVPYKHNINAYSFGEDFFNGDEDPQGGIPVYPEEWPYRTGGGFTEPKVAGGGLPIKFYFSVDPWAIGLAGTAVQSEATLAGALTLPVGPPGSADVDTGSPAPPYGLGPWRSDGEAAGDVFSSDPITTPGQNVLVHDNAILALLAPRFGSDEMEDDLDALECVGTNTLAGGIPAESGNTHDRVAPTSGVNGGVHPPGLGAPNNPNHDPINGNPIIFSIDRGSYGAPGSAVAAQIANVNEGAAGDLFIAVTIFSPLGGQVTTNMLLIDEGQLGLMPHDDLDAVIVRLLIDPYDLVTRIEEAAWNFNEMMGSYGYGFTIPLLNAGEAVVGFSVDTTSIGLMFSAVDFECRIDGGNIPGAQPPASGVMEQAGDIFFANLQPIPGSAPDAGTGITLSTNYLWFEELALGLDAGAWSLVAPSGDLGDLPDELDALDSLKGEIPPKPTAEHLKWSQPPIETDPCTIDPVYCGWNEASWTQDLGGQYIAGAADDFRCIGSMPVTSIHWWGSFINWNTRVLPPQTPSGWNVKFFANVPAGVLPYSHPGELLWEVNIPNNRVSTEWSGNDYFPNMEMESCFQHYVDLNPEEYFRQNDYNDITVDNIYWLGITAVYPAGMEVLNPWGWKTRPAHWMDDAVHYERFPGPIWEYRPLTDPYTGESMDLAFELDTDPNYIKWEQPYTGIRDWPHYEDQPSMAFDDIFRQAADDWLCTKRMPVTAIVWWGSYLWYNYQPCMSTTTLPPVKPDYFLINIWTDVPATSGPDPNHSHPGVVLWEYKAYDYDEVLVGYDKQPEYEIGPPREAVFRYSLRLPEDKYFKQKQVNKIFWISIMAVYQNNYPNYQWGWTNHQHFYNDDAVAGHWEYMPDPVWVWEEIHDQTGASADLSFMLFTDPNMCYSCADYDSSGLINFKDFAQFALEWMWSGLPGGYNKADLNCDGDVNYEDLKIFRDQWLQSCPP